jgi:hypothetical protein
LLAVTVKSSSRANGMISVAADDHEVLQARPVRLRADLQVEHIVDRLDDAVRGRGTPG